MYIRGVAKHKPKTKKEKILARNKKLHNILEAERIHEDTRQSIRRRTEGKKPGMGMGGFSKPIDEQVNMDWLTKSQQLRGRVLSAKKKAKGLWRGGRK